MNGSDRFLDYREPEWVAEKLGLDKNTVYKYLQDGSLPGVQLGRKWLVSERLLAEHLERETRRQTQMRSGVNTGGLGAFRGAGRQRMPKTPRLRQAMDAARGFAQQFGADEIGTEHALLGLAEITDGVGAIVLRNLGATREKLRQSLLAHAPQRPPHQQRRTPVSNATRHAYELAVDQAIGLGHNYVGGEHLLLGILLERTGLGARMLGQLGITYDAARTELLKHIQDGVTGIEKDAEERRLIEERGRSYFSGSVQKGQP